MEKVILGRRGCNLGRAWKESGRLRFTFVLSMLVLCGDLGSVRWHWFRWILHALNSRTLALVSKYAIDARFLGWFKPTYLEMNQMHLKILTHLKNSRH